MTIPKSVNACTDLKMIVPGYLYSSSDRWNSVTDIVQTNFCRFKMERLKIQDNSTGVGSRDVAPGGVCTEPLDLSGESYDNCEATIGDPGLCGFLSSLSAKEEKGVCPGGDHTYHTFTFPPGAYTKKLESLRESDVFRELR